MERKMNRRNRSSGFTLVELLVVVSIIALLISILLPSLQKARDGAKRTMCQANLRSLGLGFHIYADAYKGTFPACVARYQASWGLGGMYWHQRLVEEGLALGKNKGPKQNNAVCPADKDPWTPYTWVHTEEVLYNTSYGANPIALLVDNNGDNIHDWNFPPYQNRTYLRRDSLRWAAYLVLVTEVRGPEDRYFLTPKKPNYLNNTDGGNWAWGRHDRGFDGKQGGFINMLHADGSVGNSRFNHRIIGLEETEDSQGKTDLAREVQARRQFVPNP